GGVATVNGSNGDQQSESSGGGSDGGPADESEMQDAALKYAKCMRDHGIDMPDPQFDDGGGVKIQVNGGAGGGKTGGPAKAPGGDKFEAADKACKHFIEDVAGKRAKPSPEDVARMQDQLLAMAKGMRDKGYDFPDPQATDDGKVRIGGGPGDGGPGGEGGGPDDQFVKDQESCSKQAGMDGRGGPGLGKTTRSS